MFVKPFATNTVLFLVSIVGCLVIIELALKLVSDRYDPDNKLRFIPDGPTRPPLGAPGNWRHISKFNEFNVTVKFNSLGLRDVKILSAKAKPGMIALGDSFTMGFGVEEDQRFSSLVEKNIKRPIYNVAIPGDAVSYAKLLSYAQNNGAQIDGLIIGVDVENDIQAYGVPAFYDIPSKLSLKIPETDFTNGIQGLKSWLKRHTALYSLLTETVHSVPALANIFRKIGLAETDVGSLIPTNRSDKIINISVNAFNAIGQNLPRLFVIIPSRKLWMGEERKVAKETHQRIIKTFKEHGLFILDLKPIFEKNKNPLRFIFPKDGHWNTEGHQLAALHIQKALINVNFFSSP